MSLNKSHSRSTNMSQQLCALTLMALILGYGTFAAPQFSLGGLAAGIVPACVREHSDTCSVSAAARTAKKLMHPSFVVGRILTVDLRGNLTD